MADEPSFSAAAEVVVLSVILCEKVEADKSLDIDENESETRSDCLNIEVVGSKFNVCF